MSFSKNSLRNIAISYDQDTFPLDVLVIMLEFLCDIKTQYYYNTDNVWYKKLFVNGVEHGEHSEWFENGCLRYTIRYDNGVKHGECSEFYKNGKPRYVIRYDNGVKYNV